MDTMDMLPAKSNLYKLLASIEMGKEKEVIIAHNGRPVAKLVPLTDEPNNKKIGVAKGLFEIGENIDQSNDEITVMYSEQKHVIS